MPALPGHTTGREPLSSHGSHSRATLPTKLPVSKEPQSAPRAAQQPLLRSPKMVSKLLVFPRPSGKHAVEVPSERVEPRAVKPPVVLDPAPDDRVKRTGEILKRLVAAQEQLPGANLLPYGLARFLRNGRTEVDEVPSLPTLRADVARTWEHDPVLHPQTQLATVQKIPETGTDQLTGAASP